MGLIDSARLPGQRAPTTLGFLQGFGGRRLAEKAYFSSSETQAAKELLGVRKVNKPCQETKLVAEQATWW